MNNKIIVIGQNSFFSGLLRKFSNVDNLYSFISFEKLSHVELAEARCVINFACHPYYKTHPYSRDFDISLKIAEKLQGLSIHLIVMSSRMVYLNNKNPHRETDEVKGLNQYGKNCICTEHEIRKFLGDSFTILRLSNVIGDELIQNRETFMAKMLKTLKEENKITFDIPATTVKDFLPDIYFVEMLERVILKMPRGIFNMGAGFGTSINNIAHWVIDGYQLGQVEYVNNRKSIVGESFVMNIDKLYNLTGLSFPVDSLRQRCFEIGRNLKNGI